MVKVKFLLKVCELASVTKTVDYETTKNLSITVKVTDANSHIFSKGFDFAITDGQCRQCR
jgi:hypothetical protein